MAVGIRMEWLVSCRDWVMASDPGLARLRFASRTTVTVALALAATDIFATLAAQPLPVMLIGIVAALLASVAVNDASDRDKKITLLLVPLPTAATLTLGALATGSRFAGDGLFVAVVFAAVYARRVGPRGFALGMLGFITYFFALFLQARLNALPAYMASLIIGLVCSFVMRFVLWPDQPALLLRRTTQTLEAQITRVVDALLAVVGAGRLEDSHRRRLRRRFVQLNNTALTAEGHAEQLRDDAHARTSRAPAPLEIFDLELAVEHMAAVVIERAQAGPAPATRQALQELRRMLRTPSVVAATSAGEGAGEPLRGAISDVVSGLAALRKPGQAAPPRHNADAAPDSRSPAPPGLAAGARLLPSTRQAIQAATAASIAIAAGDMVSANRWYWAAITAFIVFTGTTSRGDALIKGWQRLAGTLAGVGVGVFVATSVHGDRALSLALIFACIFLAFYLIQISYGLMIFWVTIVLALLYGLMGAFSPALLILRLEETAVGAAAGMLVSLWLLPTRTRSHVRAATLDYLQAVIDLLDHGFASQPGAWSECARTLDRRFQALRTAARPLTAGVAGMFSRSGARSWLRAMLALRHHSRHFARARSGLEPGAFAATLDDETRRARQRVETLANRIRGRPPAQSVRAAPQGTPLRGRGDRQGEQGGGRQHAARVSLQRIEQIVHNLERDFFGQ